MLKMRAYITHLMEVLWPLLGSWVFGAGWPKRQKNCGTEWCHSFGRIQVAPGYEGQPLFCGSRDIARLLRGSLNWYTEIQLA